MNEPWQLCNICCDSAVLVGVGFGCSLVPVLVFCVWDFGRCCGSYTPEDLRELAVGAKFVGEVGENIFYLGVSISLDPTRLRPMVLFLAMTTFRLVKVILLMHSAQKVKRSIDTLPTSSQLTVCHDIEVHSKYGQLHSSVMKILLLLVAQLSLIVMLFKQLHEIDDWQSQFRFTFWVLAMPMQVIASRQLGFSLWEEGALSQWIRLFERAFLDSQHRLVWYRTSQDTMHLVCLWNICARFFCTFIVNGVFREVLLKLMPLFMALQTSTNLDFVMNSFAITFVVTLDDVPESKKYQYQTYDAHRAADPDEEMLLWTNTRSSQINRDLLGDF